MFYVYIYRDPTTLVPRYVGKGKGYRSHQHMTPSCQNAALRGWIKNLQTEGHAPVIEITYAIDESHAFFLEKCLIQMFGRRDQSAAGLLFNHTDGGDGISGYVPTLESRLSRSAKLKGIPKPPRTEAMRAAASAKGKGRIPWNKGKTYTDEHKAILSAAHTGKKQSAETIAKRVEKLKGHVCSPETREKIAASKRGKTRKKESQ